MYRWEGDQEGDTDSKHATWIERDMDKVSSLQKEQLGISTMLNGQWTFLNTGTGGKGKVTFQKGREKISGYEVRWSLF